MIGIQDKKIINVSDFDDLVSETYGRFYSFQQQDGCKEPQTVYFSVPVSDPDDYENASIPEEINGDIMGVSFKAWLARDPKDWNGDINSVSFLALFWGRNFYPSVDMVLNDLYEKELLPAGEYGIEIDW